MNTFMPTATLPNFPTLLEAIRHFGGPDAEVVAQEAAPGGCINNGFSVTLRRGQRCFVKMNRRDCLDMFRQEAVGLNALALAAERSASGLLVPKPISHGIDGEYAFLLLEYLPPVRPTTRYWEALGQGLARLHSHSVMDLFGFETDNYIGTTKQRNSWSDKWPAFFAKHRLKPQLDLAKRHGRASPALISATESIIERIDKLLPDLDTAHLVHGDLWSGNVLSAADQGGTGVERAALIDPACYYGDSRVDLAMTELFGGFPPVFLAAYRAVRDPGGDYRQVKDLYNLYHVLNHLNIMGREYAADALRLAEIYS